MTGKPLPMRPGDNPEPVRAADTDTGASASADRAVVNGAASVSAVPASVPSADDIWTGSKKQREALRGKFGGRCAYCGNRLDKMQADHMEPVVRIQPNPWNGRTKVEMLKPERNVVGNMMPACPSCNKHKGGYTLEQWRDLLQRSAAILRRDTSTFRAGERFGVIMASERPIRFFFERWAEACDFCRDPESGLSLYPQYGVAPHECYWRKGPQFTLGQSTLLPIEDWDVPFVPELDVGETWANFAYPSACGTYYCPICQSEKFGAAWDRLISIVGEPPAQGTPTRSAETAGLGPKDGGPVGNADAPEQGSKATGVHPHE